LKLTENTLDNATTCENVEGPCELIRRDEISKAIKMMKKGKAVLYKVICKKIDLLNTSA